MSMNKTTNLMVVLLILLLVGTGIASASVGTESDDIIVNMNISKIVYWITGFTVLTTLFIMLDQTKNRESKITDENLKKSAIMSCIIIGLIFFIKVVIT